jgi:hypothetical protein
MFLIDTWKVTIYLASVLASTTSLDETKLNLLQIGTYKEHQCQTIRNSNIKRTLMSVQTCIESSNHHNRIN